MYQQHALSKGMKEPFTSKLLCQAGFLVRTRESLTLIVPAERAI